MEWDEARDAALRTARALRNALPMLVGVLLLVSLALTAIPGEAYSAVFTGNPVLDPLLGAAAGSVAAGNPINSYVIGGELLGQGVSLLAVAAFIIAWVTVGVVQLPAEMLMLGRRFALARNGVSFAMSIVISIMAVWLLGGI